MTTTKQLPEEAPAADLDKLLEAEMKRLRSVCEPEGRKAELARFLGIRPNEVSRYLAGGRSPSAALMAGMREFIRLHTAAAPKKRGPRNPRGMNGVGRPGASNLPRGTWKSNDEWHCDCKGAPFHTAKQPTCTRCGIARPLKAAQPPPTGVTPHAPWPSANLRIP